ncbi:hypothetical protein C8J57DRAFT_1215029 [Mycena rebaudengoi]|nr:hypothetical protein C8J57DRAFT_1215029 [Mycena rebaudengoi]
MQPSTSFKNMIQYTTIAATTAKEIADSARVPFLGSMATLTLSIFKSVELYSTSKITRVLSTALLYDIAKFTEVLQQVFTFLKSQQGMGKIKQVFTQPDNTVKLETCKQELNHTCQKFKVHITGSTISQMVQMQKDAKQQHEELMALLAALPDLTSPDLSSVDGTLSSFNDSPPSLLILDNLKTPLESISSQSEVEEFLSLLADVAHLGLMITMRGAERPAKVKWTRPFLPPLDPLLTSAALQTFINVANDTHHQASVEHLLELTGNLPLAVSLISSVASHEGCDKALSCWKSESTHMLSDGYDQRSSLDISIMLSFTSSRMTPGAQDLLSLLSMLPDGLVDVELVQAKLAIPDILVTKVLCRR